jgi:hypothetical protein
MREMTLADMLNTMGLEDGYAEVKQMARNGASRDETMTFLIARMNVGDGGAARGDGWPVR